MLNMISHIKINVVPKADVIVSLHSLNKFVVLSVEVDGCGVWAQAKKG
jgi:hypothetical protein